MKDKKNLISRRFIGKQGDEYQIDRANRSFGRKYQAKKYFKQYVSDKDIVLDLGCNDGLFLRYLPAKKRIGVDVNEAARRECAAASVQTGIEVEVHNDISTVESNSIDVAMSNHCLEHTIAPFDILTEVKRVLKPGCVFIIVTPFDDWRNPIHTVWKPNDFDNHLYTWSPMNLGNLLTEVGFKVEETQFCRTTMSKKLYWLYNLFGDSMFRIACRLLAWHLRKGEVFIRARKPFMKISR